MEKLLILGGNRLSCDIVAAAKAKGVYTIVTDWYDTRISPAKLISDEFWNISTMDYEILTSKIREEHITGVLTGFSDSYLIPYQHLCELNHLPCYATKEQFEWTLDKSSFKAKCKEYDVPTVPEYDTRQFDAQLITKIGKIIIKPVDNSGSRGICICDNPDEYEEKLSYALSYSEKKQVVIERYMDCDDVSFEYTIQDGECMLSAICDRYIFKTEEGGSVTSKLIYPSKYTEAYMADVDAKVRTMFRQEGLKNGVLFMQAFVEKGQFYFYEMGYRLSGGRHYLFTEKENGRSAAKELVCFAVSGSMSPINLSAIVNPRFKDVCCQLSVLCKNQRIAVIKGQQEINDLPEVIDSTYFYEIGDEIGKEGTTAQIFSRIHIIADTREYLSTIINRIKETLIVENENRENIVIW